MNFIKLFAFAFVLVFMSFSTVKAQLQYNAVANYAPTNIETKSLVILFTSDISKRNIKGESTQMDIDARKAAEERYDRSALKEFGSYMNPYSNQFHVVTNNNVKYSRIQITDKTTGEVVIKKELNAGKNMLDFTTMQPGTYILIMSDSGTNIFSEEITVT